MSRIDTHLHLILPELFDYDWINGIPALVDQVFDGPDYLAAAADSDIDAAIFVEVDVAEKDFISEAAHLCALAENQTHGIVGVIAACRPENADFDAQLETLKHPHLLGFRRVLHTQHDDLSTSELFRQNIARIGAACLTFDLCVLPHQLAIGAELIDACPNTQFILDHCGVPNIAAGDLGFWREQLRELARRPHLACKISGIIAYAQGDAAITADTLRPVVEHAIDCFGWDRVLWGSDWPVCNLTRDLRTWTTLLDEILAPCAPTERAQLYRDNARRIYQLNSVPG